MRIEIPVITRCGPSLKFTDYGAEIVNKSGMTTWVFNGQEVTGKGIFIAACTRSATMYITRLLEKLGYDIGHEHSRKDGSVGYHLALFKPENCLHQVRHPLLQIASQLDNQSWGFIDQIFELYGHGLLGCMQYWLFSNEMIEEFAVWRYQIEQLPDIWEEFLKHIDHPYEPMPKMKKVNTREMSLACTRKEFTTLTWDDLYSCNEKLAEKIYVKAINYGYRPVEGQTTAFQVLG